MGGELSDKEKKMKVTSATGINDMLLRVSSVTNTRCPTFFCARRG